MVVKLALLTQDRLAKEERLATHILQWKDNDFMAKSRKKAVDRCEEEEGRPVEFAYKDETDAGERDTEPETEAP